MGKEKMVKKIDDISARQVSFSKRRQGLVKKAQELSTLCEAEVAVMVFSPTRRFYQYSSSNMKDILNKFAMQSGSERQSVGFRGRSKNHSNLSKEAQDKIHLLKEIETQHLQHFTVDGLDQLEMKLDGILRYVTAKKEVYSTGTSGTQSKDSSCSENVLPYSSVERNDQSGAPNYPERWTAPPAGVYKVNFSGTKFQNGDASGVGVGVVVRNWKGDFMAAIARFFPEVMDVNFVSWMAATCAIEFAVDYSFTHIMLEGDIPDTIMGLKDTYKDTSPASTIILQEAKGYMMQLDSCFFSHVQTSGNTAAHMVAQYARGVRDELVWLMQEPDFLADTLLADVLATCPIHYDQGRTFAL